MHADRLGDADARRCRAGRVGLIGEHTDYNDGFVFPMAIPFGTAVAISPRPDRRVVGQRPLRNDRVRPRQPATTDGWAATSTACSDVGRPGVEVGGFSATVVSDIPGSSLSSSLRSRWRAAWRSRAVVPPSPGQLARLGQRVENEIIGVPVGIMDQLISAAGVRGSATLIDCRSLQLRQAALPDAVRVVVLDTGTRRGLVDSEYAHRRAACERVAAALGVQTLRDANLEQVARIGVDPVDRRRAHHVVSENERTLAAADAVDAGDVVSLGRLMDESHESLHLDFGHRPSTARSGRTRPNARGMPRRPHDRCRICRRSDALVETPAVEAFVDTMTERFEAPVDQPSTEPPHSMSSGPCRGARGTTLGVSILSPKPSPGASVSGYGARIPFVTGTSTAEVLAAVEADASVTFPVVAKSVRTSDRPQDRRGLVRLRIADTDALAAACDELLSKAVPGTVRSRSSSPRWSTATAS